MQSIFAAKSDLLQGNRSKRTFVKRPSGQIMTENYVLEQMKEQKRKKDLKKPTGVTRKSTVKKSRKTDQNGMFVNGLVSRL